MGAMEKEILRWKKGTWMPESLWNKKKETKLLWCAQESVKPVYFSLIMAAWSYLWCLSSFTAKEEIFCIQDVRYLPQPKEKPTDKHATNVWNQLATYQYQIRATTQTRPDNFWRKFNAEWDQHFFFNELTGDWLPAKLFLICTHTYKYETCCINRLPWHGTVGWWWNTNEETWVLVAIVQYNVLGRLLLHSHQILPLFLITLTYRIRMLPLFKSIIFILLSFISHKNGTLNQTNLKSNMRIWSRNWTKNSTMVAVIVITLYVLQDILHSKPLTTWTPSMALLIAENSSRPAYFRLFLHTPIESNNALINWKPWWKIFSS